MRWQRTGCCVAGIAWIGIVSREFPETLKKSTAGAEQPAEKGLGWKIYRYELLQGLKPVVAMIGFIGPAKAVPLLQSV
jgi:hypothetical protein